MPLLQLKRMGAWAHDVSDVSFFILYKNLLAKLLYLFIQRIILETIQC